MVYQLIYIPVYFVYYKATNRFIWFITNPQTGLDGLLRDLQTGLAVFLTDLHTCLYGLLTDLHSSLIGLLQSDTPVNLVY